MFAKCSSCLGIASRWDTWEQSWIVFALSLSLQATSRVYIDTCLKVPGFLPCGVTKGLDLQPCNDTTFKEDSHLPLMP